MRLPVEAWTGSFIPFLCLEFLVQSSPNLPVRCYCWIPVRVSMLLCSVAGCFCFYMFSINIKLNRAAITVVLVPHHLGYKFCSNILVINRQT